MYTDRGNDDRVARCWGRALIMLTMIAGCASTSQHTPPIATQAPPAEVARLRPADLPGGDGKMRIVQSPVCEPSAVATLKNLPTQLLNTSACTAASDRLKAFIAAACAEGEDAVQELTEKFQACVGLLERAHMPFGVSPDLVRASINRALRTLPSSEAIHEPVTPTARGAGVPFESLLINAVTDFVVARAKAEVLGWVADEQRVADGMEGMKAIEVKDVAGQIDVEQFNAYVNKIKESEAGSGEIEQLVYVFTKPEGAIANLAYLADRFPSLKRKLTVEVYDRTGEKLPPITNKAEDLRTLNVLRSQT